MQGKRDLKSKIKIALIMRGVPGSGKSTFCNFIKSFYGNTILHEVDLLHTKDGVFSWDEENSGDLYDLNFSNFKESCSQGEEVVICDCMNLKFSEVQKYVDAAKDFGYHCYVVSTEFPDSALASERNLHGVSLEQIQEMKSQWENWP